MKSDRFTQFEDYAAAVIHADLQLKIPRLVQSQWELQTEGLGQISLQLGREGSGIIAEGSAQQDGYTLFVPLAGLQYANGQALDEQKVFLMTPGGELAIASKVPHDWCSIVLPFEVLGQAAQVPQDFSYPLGTSLVVDVENGTMKRLRQVLFEIAYALKSDPTLLFVSAAKESLQRELLAACKPIVAAKKRSELTMGRPTLCRRDIIQRLTAIIENGPSESLSIDFLVNEVGVSVRTLRNIFLEYYGLSPHRFLVVHRLHQARKALRLESTESAKVTTIAAEYGFWHFGRFAHEYRQLFGESPSQTLSRPASRR
jgi:AraC family transcriptional regulator, ethanolamine operon transcriptional activator